MQLTILFILYMCSSSIIRARSFIELFRGVRSKLTVYIDVSHGLLDHLSDNEVITRNHVDDIKAYQTERDRVDRLLSILERRDDKHVAGFCQALIDTGQQPVVDKYLHPRDVPVRVAANDHDASSIDALFTRTLNEAQDLIYNELVPDPEIQSILAQLRHKDLPQFKSRPLYGELYSQVKNTLSKLRIPLESLRTLSKLCTNLLVISMANDSPTKTTRSILVLLRYEDIDSVRRIGEQQQAGSLDHLLAEDVVKLFDCKTNLTVSVHWYICDNTLALPASDTYPEIGSRGSTDRGSSGTPQSETVVAAQADFTPGQTKMDATTYLPVVIIAVPTVLYIIYITLRTKVHSDNIGVTMTSEHENDHVQFMFPVEVIEMIMMRTFLIIFTSELDKKDNLTESGRIPYVTLSSVCCTWWMTLMGWPGSPTKHWVRHTLQRIIKYYLMGMYRAVQSSFENCKDILVHSIEPSYGLLNQLRTCGLISSRHQITIEQRSTVAKRNAQLLNSLSTSTLGLKQCAKLLAALKQTQQEHILNVLLLHSGFDNQKLEATYGDVRPLTREQQSFIDASFSSLSELIKVDGLLEELQTEKCITPFQKQCFTTVRTVTPIVPLLLDVLKRRSVHAFKSFISCLERTGQHIVASIIENGQGVIMPFEITLQADDDDAPGLGFASEIAERFMSRQKTEDLMFFAERPESDVLLISVKAINFTSIRTFVLCRSADGFNHINNVYTNGQLKEHVQQMCKALVPEYELVINDISRKSVDFLRGLQHFYRHDQQVQPFVSTLKRNISNIAAEIKTTPGLLQQLVVNRLITPEQKRNVMTRNTCEENNAQLVEYLVTLDDEQLVRLSEVMCSTDQKSVFNLMYRTSVDATYLDVGEKVDDKTTVHPK